VRSATASTFPPPHRGTRVTTTARARRDLTPGRGTTRDEASAFLTRATSPAVYQGLADARVAPAEDSLDAAGVQRLLPATEHAGAIGTAHPVVIGPDHRAFGLSSRSSRGTCPWGASSCR